MRGALDCALGLVKGRTSSDYDAMHCGFREAELSGDDTDAVTLPM